ncbi:hypothetical protein [Planctellipticum variicoloris]|uniref:hypothetical protein n=1 Tax=Planctellipticum variicoloris TaxID=3064265 RepID=UPI003013DF43|nr:hypothetical protein SH412_004164 [Planctomycetaceae bacterium SH412]
MNQLDPQQLFVRIAQDIPQELRQHLFVTGSLAAAYHYKARLGGQGINTKDADLVVHPAGDTNSCGEMTTRLRGNGWQNTSECYPRQTAEPETDLRAIRLFPPGSREYFIEFLNIPQKDQGEAKLWIPIELNDGWYGLPSFRFLGIASMDRLTSDVGLEYARPSMMALANLLSHPEVGTVRIESGEMRGVLRSAKDLGRVIALARLEGRDGTAAWINEWRRAMEECFPAKQGELLSRLGSGLEELLSDENALKDAWKTTDVGLLNGLDVTAQMLKATGDRLLDDVIRPLRDT